MMDANSITWLVR